MAWEKINVRLLGCFGRVVVVFRVMAVCAFSTQALAQEKPGWTLPKLVQHALDNN